MALMNSKVLFENGVRSAKRFHALTVEQLRVIIWPHLPGLWLCVSECHNHSRNLGGAQPASNDGHAVSWRCVVTCELKSCRTSSGQSLIAKCDFVDSTGNSESCKAKLCRDLNVLAAEFATLQKINARFPGKFIGVFGLSRAGQVAFTKRETFTGVNIDEMHAMVMADGGNENMMDVIEYVCYIFISTFFE